MSIPTIIETLVLKMFPQGQLHEMEVVRVLNAPSDGCYGIGLVLLWMANGNVSHATIRQVASRVARTCERIFTPRHMKNHAISGRSIRTKTVDHRT